MNNVVITLGGVPFQDFEVPERIVFGGGQRVAVHQLIGGGRVVDALGNEDGDIVFTGIFSGASAAERSQALDAARALGVAIPLVWESFFYTVLIKEFTAVYTKPWWIPFTLRCVVVSDPLAQVAALAAPVAALISNDVAAAAAYGVQAGLSLVGLEPASLAGFSSTQIAVNAGIASSGSNLAASSGNLGGAGDAYSGIAALNGSVAASGQLAALAGLKGYVNRAATNFANQLI